VQDHLHARSTLAEAHAVPLFPPHFPSPNASFLCSRDCTTRSDRPGRKTLQKGSHEPGNPPTPPFLSGSPSGLEKPSHPSGTSPFASVQGQTRGLPVCVAAVHRSPDR